MHNRKIRFYWLFTLHHFIWLPELAFGYALCRFWCQCPPYHGYVIPKYACCGEHVSMRWSLVLDVGFFAVVLSCLNLLTVAPICGHSWLLAPLVLWFCLNAIANQLPRLCPLCLPMSTINNISGPVCYLFCSYTFRLVPHSRYHVPLIVVLSISQRKRFVNVSWVKPQGFYYSNSRIYCCNTKFCCLMLL